MELADYIRRVHDAGFTANLFQQAFWNGLFKFAGLKVLHVMFPDGMLNCFLHSLRTHDARMRDMFKLEGIMKAMNVNGDVARQIIYFTQFLHGSFLSLDSRELL
jgi:hypothetical protein